MEPDKLSLCLKRLASFLDRGAVTREAAASAINGLILATDKSLALAVREALHAEIEKLMPGKFELYDTNPDGKGWRAGYVSFGLGPSQWKDEGIIGGVLIQADYNPKLFRSEAPEPADPKFQHSQGGGILELTITGCYYNKLQGGGCDSDTAVGVVGLSGADVYVDDKESVFQIDIVDPGMMTAGLDKIIREISSNPPDYAQSEGRKRKSRAPTGSPQSLMAWLVQQNRSDVGQSEIDALANAQSAKSGKAVGNAKKDIADFFRSRQWPINPNA